MFQRFSLAAAPALLLASSLTQAHFQMVYTPELLRDKGGAIELSMPFTHPAENGTVMVVEEPISFVHVKKGESKDLLSTVEKTTWTSAANKAVSYKAPLKIRGLGDNVLLHTMAPYFEPEEDIYMQQFTKTIINVGGFPTDWDTDFGLEAEIVPLDKPYAILAGGTFSGVVKSNGKAVPNAEIEVEYVNYLPDQKGERFQDQSNVEWPSDAFITMTIFANDQGVFTFGIPFAGQWGFAALGVGPESKIDGKEVSKDAVIWVQAHDVKVNGK